MRALVASAVRRRVTVVMFALATAAFGVVGYQRLPLELFPNIAYPSLTVQTDFPDTAPQEVENLVSRRVEEAVGVVRGLHTIRSVSRSGTSEVTLEFDWGSNMDLLSGEVRDKLDRVILPEGAESPIVLRFDPSLDPILRLALTGDGELTALRVLAERKIKQNLETIQGVAASQVSGGLEEEIHIDVDQERLAALRIPLDRVREVVSSSNVNVPGGALRGTDSQFLVRTVNEFESVEEIAELIIWDRAGAQVKLGEVAKVRRGAKEREEILRVNGREAVELAVYKEGDANTVQVARDVRAAIQAWSTKLPRGHQLEVLFDQSGFIQQALEGVFEAALLGGALATLVLLLFLRDLRSTAIIATSIPLSIVATFVAMYRLDISLNIMSLGGLTLGIGMLVDSSIVVLESIFRKRTVGQSLASAAVSGTAEVGPAVAASTLTTVAVFLPIVFVEGIAGQLFKDQALTVTISLLASLLVAVTVIPMLSAIGRDRAPQDRGQQDGHAGGAKPAPTILEGPASESSLATASLPLGPVSRLYGSALRGALRWRWLTLLIAFALLGVAIQGLQRIGTELIPVLSEGEFFFEVNLPEGTPLAGTDRILGRLEAISRADPTIERSYATVGTRLVSGGMSLNTKAENLGQLNLVLKDRADAAGEVRAAENLRQQCLDIPDLELKFGRPSYFSLKTPIEVILYGEILEDLRTYSLELAQRLENVPGLVDVRSSLEAGSPEVQVVFDRQRLATLGLDMATLTDTLQQRVQGVIPTLFREEDRQIDIRIRNTEATRKSIEDVRRLIIPGPDGTPLRLLTVADIRLDRSPAEIHRLQQQRAAVIVANVDGRSLGGAIREVEAMLAENPPPRGISTELGGQTREMETSFRSLVFALALATFLVYLVMASIFESFVHPFVVLFTVPLSLIGVVVGLLATGTTITVIVLIGAVMLVGIVVNNSIVLIDTIHRLRQAGLEKEAAVARAGHLRLRPILMTTLTTVLGLLPLALASGEGAELRAPLAITVASGLIASTLITLLVIPAAYMVLPSHAAPSGEDFDEGGSK